MFEILIFVLFFIMGALGLKINYIPSKNSIARPDIYKEGAFYAVKGVVRSSPVTRNGRSVFILGSREVCHNGFRYRVGGDIMVSCSDDNKVYYLEELMLFGILRRPFYRASGKISAPMVMRNPRFIASVRQGEAGFSLGRAIFLLRERLSMSLSENLSSVTCGMNRAMCLGEKNGIPPAVYDSMVKSGTVHVLVISGFHVGIVFFACTLFFKLLRIPRRIRLLLSVFFLVTYCFIAGAAVPAVRATIMCAFFIFGSFIKRPVNAKDAFFAAALLILLVSPQEVFSVSFQLSFLSVGSILWLYPVLKSFFKVDGVKNIFLKPALKGFFVSFSSWLGTSWFIAYHFRIISPVALLANLVIIPLAAVITVLGLVTAVLGFLSPNLTLYFAYADEAVTAALLRLNSLFISLPWAYLYL